VPSIPNIKPPLVIILAAASVRHVVMETTKQRVYYDTLLATRCISVSKTAWTCHCRVQKIIILLTAPVTTFVWNHVFVKHDTWLFSKPSNFGVKLWYDFHQLKEFCISQGSGVPFCRCGGQMHNHLWLICSRFCAPKLLKSVHFGRSYSRKGKGCVFWTTV